MSRTDLRAFTFIEGTKISHNMLGDKVEHYSYRDLVERRVPCIGVPARINRLLVIDVDVPGSSHHHDGRGPWERFSAENNIPKTYTVQTPGGGFHYYFSLPQTVDLNLLNPRKSLYPGVDVVYKGWVGAPPTEGYAIVHGGIKDIVDIPDELLVAVQVRDQKGDPIIVDTDLPPIYIHTSLSTDQLRTLKDGIAWVQENVALSYHQWRDGIMSMKAGIDDPILMEEYITLWTKNKAYSEGDVEKALAMAHKATAYGPIGPGTIVSLIRELALLAGSVHFVGGVSKKDILEATGVPLKVGKTGALGIEPSENNIALIMEQLYPASDLYYDVRDQQVIFRDEQLNFEDATNMFLMAFQDRHKGLGLGGVRKNVIMAGLELLIYKRKVDRERNRLSSIHWDGKGRIDTFFIEQFRLPNTEYHIAVSKNFWIAMAARIMKPGIKFDYMIVLQSHEGIGKSSLLETIGGRYYYSLLDTSGIYAPEGIRKMHQAILVELPELLGFKNRGPELVKATLSTTRDKVRYPYARHAVDVGRGFIIVGTTNESHYLNPQMGRRRFWPIRIDAKKFCVNLKKAHQDRDQLFAEAIHRFNNGEPFHILPGDSLSGLSVRSDPIGPTVKELCSGKSKVSLVDIYQGLSFQGLVKSGLTHEIGERIERCLYDMGAKRSSSEVGAWYLGPDVGMDSFMG